MHVYSWVEKQPFGSSIAEVGKLFLKRASRKYFRCCGPYSIYPNYSTLSLWSESGGHGQLIDEKLWLSSNKTLLMQPSRGWVWSLGCSLPIALVWSDFIICTRHFNLPACQVWGGATCCVCCRVFIHTWCSYVTIQVSAPLLWWPRRPHVPDGIVIRWCCVLQSRFLRLCMQKSPKPRKPWNISKNNFHCVSYLNFWGCLF